MTLPRAMLGVFPEEGEVTLVEGDTGEEHVANMSHPRVVAGLGPLYRQFELNVNDELILAKEGPRRFQFNVLKRPQSEPNYEPVQHAGFREPAQRDAEGAAGAPVSLDPRAITTRTSVLMDQVPLFPGTAPSPEEEDDDTPATENGEDLRRAQLVEPARSEWEASRVPESVTLATRLRRTLVPLGFHVHPVSSGLLMIRAELGRRSYGVLVQLLTNGDRLDWAALLARRRETPSNYLTVVGAEAELTRIAGPAELARATLVSWEALERINRLHVEQPVTPLELEAHFATYGLHGEGMTRFEESVRERERGAALTAALLARLALLHAPVVFMLEELAQDLSASRDEVLRALNHLTSFPLDLVTKVDDGEFLLREPVGVALERLAYRARSLAGALPQERRVVVTGLDDDSEDTVNADGEDDG